MGDDTGAELREKIKGLRKHADNHTASISQLTPEQSRQYAEWLEELVLLRKESRARDRVVARARDQVVSQADAGDLGASVEVLRGFIGDGSNVRILTPGTAQKYVDWLDELIVLREVFRNAKMQDGVVMPLTAKGNERIMGLGYRAEYYPPSPCIPYNPDTGESPQVHPDFRNYESGWTLLSAKEKVEALAHAFNLTRSARLLGNIKPALDNWDTFYKRIGRYPTKAEIQREELRKKEEEEKRLAAKQKEYYGKMLEEALASHTKNIEKTFGGVVRGTNLDKPFFDDQELAASYHPKTTAADLGLSFALDRSCHILEGSVFLAYPKHHSFRLSWGHPYIPFDPKTGESPEIAPDFRVSHKMFEESTLGGKLFFLAEGYKRTIARRQEGDRNPNGMRHEYDWYYYKHRFYPSGVIDRKWCGSLGPLGLLR